MLNRICLLACTLLLAATGSSGVPVMDGDRDADYLCVSQSPRDNLLVDVSKNINDPADPRSRSLDVEGLWAANSDTHLFLYIELPYLDLNTIAGFVTFRGLWALFIHSNTNIRFGFLEVLLGSPHLHHWHHELDKRGLCNYANLSPLMDLAFGTYYNPPGRPQKYGTAEPVRQAWFWQLIDPLLPRRR